MADLELLAGAEFDTGDNAMISKRILMAAGLAMGVLSGSAHAAYVVTIAQVGSDVLVTGSGSVDTSVFSSTPSEAYTPGFISPASGDIAIAEGVGSAYYSVDISGPSSFGSGLYVEASSSNGALIGLGRSIGSIILPLNYVSGSILNSSSTYYDATLGSLGLTSGSYVYNFGNGDAIDSFTIDISTVPLPTSASLLGAALFAFSIFSLGRKKSNTMSSDTAV